MGKVVEECKIPLDIEEYAQSFNPDMIEVSRVTASAHPSTLSCVEMSRGGTDTCLPCQVLYAWTLGAKFVDVIKLTDVFEGSVIRVIRRLDEMLRQLCSASLAIGDHKLKDKFDECSKRIRRDIVFAASLYL